MSRRILLPLALGVVLLGAVPALADANGSSETTTEARSCTAPADNHYSAPGPNDCKNGATTYQATKWTNNVKCGSSNSPTPANPTGLRLYASGEPTAQSGNIGMCSDGGLPVQGRASVGGSPATGPTVTVDGDKDNGGHAATQGYVVIQAKPQPAPPSVRCGDEYGDGGRADSDSVQDRDNQAECGS